MESLLKDSKEGDSPMACPRCGSQWATLDANTLVCKCGYRHTIPLKLSYDDLAKENKLLKERIAELEGKPHQRH